MENKFVIAIDGPVGVGKGTLAVALAKRFSAIYINTGAMYRALTVACLRNNTDVRDQEKALEILLKSAIDLKTTDTGDQIVTLNGEEISKEIFLPEISNAVAAVSMHTDVRKEMVKRQKKLTERKNRIIIEGRDIATEVAPNADLKIYLTADIKTRAQRRYNQMLSKGIKTDIEKVLDETQRRDKTDTEREASPLTIADDATVIDTSDLSIYETVEKIVEKMKENGIV